jgi:hypothetical protein
MELLTERATRQDAGVVLPRTGDGVALRLWLITRLAVLAIVLWPMPRLGDFLSRWHHWDAELFYRIAQYGYDDAPGAPAIERHGIPGFFPGFPLVLRVAHLLVPDWTAAGLLVSLVTSAVAAVALCRLGDLDGPPGAGALATLAMLVSPGAVFLAAPFTEALFAGLAIPGWLLARRGQWAGAALCCAGAAGVRITGVFLAVALAVEYLTGPSGVRIRAGRRRALWLAVPFLPPLAYCAYQWARAGDFLAYQHAQQQWPAHASTSMPWDAARLTWGMAADPAGFGLDARIDVLVALAGVAGTLWLLWERRWGEFTYMALQLGVLLTSVFFISLARYMVAWFPLWLVLGRLGARRPWLYSGIAAVSAALMAVFTNVFATGGWAG